MAPAIKNPVRPAVHGNVKLAALHAAIAAGPLPSERCDAAVLTCIQQLETALRKVRSGSPARFNIEWDRNPNEVFSALEEGRELPPSQGMPCYFMEVSAGIPRLVCCTRFA